MSTRVLAEQDRTSLTALRTTLDQTASIVVFHTLKHGSQPAQRFRTEYMSDLVVNLVTQRIDDALKTRLFIPTYSGGSAVTDPN